MCSLKWCAINTPSHREITLTEQHALIAIPRASLLAWRPQILISIVAIRPNKAIHFTALCSKTSCEPAHHRKGHK